VPEPRVWSHTGRLHVRYRRDGGESWGDRIAA
jgi:hypothetical protein